MMILRILGWVALLALLASCGGGGGGSRTPATPPPTSQDATHSVQLTQITIEDQRFGETVTVTGLPVEGATLTIAR